MQWSKLRVHPVCMFWLPSERISATVHPVCTCLFKLYNYNEEHMDKLLASYAPGLCTIYNLNFEHCEWMPLYRSMPLGISYDTN